MNDCLKAFERKLLESTDRETGNTRPNQFRCSSLPICPLKWVATELINDGQIPERENIRQDIYTSIGTEIHTVLQHWGGYKGLLYGDWELETEIQKEFEGKIYSRIAKKTIRDKVGPVKCEKTGRLYKYKELVVKHPKTGLSGHVDGLVPFEDGFIIVDFKTAASSKLAEMLRPPINYHTQVMAYWYLLSKFGPYNEKTQDWREPLKIHGTVIFLLGRDNPIKDTKMFVSRTLDKELVFDQFKIYKMIQEALKTKNYGEVIAHRLCHSKAEVVESWCEHGILGCGVGNKKVAQNLKDLSEYGTQKI